MKNIIKAILAVFLGVFLITSCNKVADLPHYEDGSAPVLTASKTAITTSIADSNKKVITFTWTDPKYATVDSTTKYLVQFDSAGGNFSQPITKEVIGKLSTSFTGNELNNILLSNGGKPGTSYNLNIRVVSSYNNNNERHASGSISVNVTGFTEPNKLTSTKTYVAASAATQNDPALTFDWTQAFKSYSGTVTYAVEYDSAGKNFASPHVFDLGGATFTKEMLVSEINQTVLDEGVTPGTFGKIQYRTKAMTALGAVAYSNSVTVGVNTYSPAPDSLYIVGDATPGGWPNPVPIPSQRFTKLNATTFSLTISLTAGNSYLFLPVNGDWTHKYGGATDGTQSGGGTLLKDNAIPGSNTPAPATSGIYKIVVNFLTGKYTVTPVAIPANLYIIGDATPAGWGNPVPDPAQKFTQTSSFTFSIVINLTATKSYLFLPVNGSWDHKYGGAADGTAAGGTTLLADNDVPGSNTPAPSTTGLYRIEVNFATNAITVKPVPSDLFIVGDATPGGWVNPVSIPSQQFTQTTPGIFQLSIPLTATKSYLFLPVNGSWDHKYGGTTDGVTADGDLLADGDVPGSNTPAPPTTGTRTITVNFITMKYKVQ